MVSPSPPSSSHTSPAAPGASQLVVVSQADWDEFTNKADKISNLVQSIHSEIEARRVSLAENSRTRRTSVESIEIDADTQRVIRIVDAVNQLVADLKATPKRISDTHAISPVPALIDTSASTAERNPSQPEKGTKNSTSPLNPRKESLTLRTQPARLTKTTQNEKGYQERATTSGTKRAGENIDERPGKVSKIQDDFIDTINHRLYSGDAIAGFFDLVKEYNEYSISNKLDFGFQGDAMTRMHAAYALFIALKGRSRINDFLGHLVRFPLINALEEHNRTIGNKKTSPHVTGLILQTRGQELSSQNRKALQQELSIGRKLQMLCSGQLEGLLCFLPAFSTRNYEKMTYGQIEALQMTLDHNVVELCKIGHAFQQAILDGKRFALPDWEDQIQQRVLSFGRMRSRSLLEAPDGSGDEKSESEQSNENEESGDEEQSDEQDDVDGQSATESESQSGSKDHGEGGDSEAQTDDDRDVDNDTEGEDVENAIA